MSNQEDQTNFDTRSNDVGSSTKKTIALICASSWDAVQLPRVLSKLLNRYKIVQYGDNSIQENPDDFDAITFVNKLVNDSKSGIAPIHGVTSSSDYPGCLVAASIAHELQIAGCPIEAAFNCSHKYYSRLVQQNVVPEACPPFTLVSPTSRRIEPLTFPIFLKPVKSVLSMLASRIDTEHELNRKLDDHAIQNHLTRYVHAFNQLLEHYCPSIKLNGSYMLAEGLLSGDQVTVEGFVFEKQITIIGVVDSVMFPGTISFQRFDYPSRLPEDVQQRMGDICTRIIQHLGLDNTFFNIEMFYCPELPVGQDLKIIEINPRICGQFADLYEGVDGTNTFEILIAIAAGDKPYWTHRKGSYKVAASFPLRKFNDACIVHIPQENDFQNILRKWQHVTIAKSFCNQIGQLLSELGQYDGMSFKYGVVNMVGHSLESMLEEFECVKEELGFKFDPIIENN